MAGYVNPFISRYVPQAWQSQIAVFGRQVDYWPDNDPAQAVTITLIWKEGAEDESASPGRYSHATVQNVDLPANPKPGDAVVNDGIEYDVVRVNALITNYSTIVLQDRSEDF